VKNKTSVAMRLQQMIFSHVKISYFLRVFKYNLSQWPKTLYNTYVYIIKLIMLVIYKNTHWWLHVWPVLWYVSPVLWYVSPVLWYVPPDITDYNVIHYNRLLKRYKWPVICLSGTFNVSSALFYNCHWIFSVICKSPALQNLSVLTDFHTTDVCQHI
jgi:hypothetical protein